MAENLSEIIKIIESGLRDEVPTLAAYSSLLAEKLEKAGDLESAELIRKVIEKNSKSQKMEPRSSILNVKSLVDPESHLSLATVQKYEQGEVFIVLDEESKDYLEEFINLINRREELSQKNINAYGSLLLYGPPGVGKSQAAKYISSRTSLPLVTIRLEGLISSYLGSTSKNIKVLFDFVKANPCILFLDEFDAIAKARDDSNEIGELKRVVNSLLQNIDDLREHVPIIAATNHENLLDSAVWRRFEYKISLKLPDRDQRLKLITHFIPSTVLKEKQIALLSILSDGMSGSESEMLANYIKLYKAANSAEITNKIMFSIFVKYKNRSNHNSKTLTSEVEKLKFLNELKTRFNKPLTFEVIGDLLGMPPSTANYKSLKLTKNGSKD